MLFNLSFIVGDSAEEALNLMTGAACLINKTLNDVLLLHAIEEGSLKLIKKPFHFQEVLKSSMKYAQSLADKSMIVMELEGPQEDDIKTSLLVGDRLRLENVIRSLLMNAIQSSFPRSVVTIKISIQFRDAHLPKPRFQRLISNIRFPTQSQFPLDMLSKDVILSNSKSHSHSLSDGQPPSPQSATILQNASNDMKAHSPSSIVDSSEIISTFGQTFNKEGSVKNEVRTQTFQAASTSKTNSCDATVRGNEELRHMSTTSTDPKVESGLKATFTRKSSRVAASLPGICEVTLLVIDQGTGMSKEDLKGLMQPYSQIIPDYSEQGRTTGLWLVLAKEIINLHDGEIVAASQIGLGSTFGFRIPFELASPLDERPSSPIRSIVSSGSCLKALSVENDIGHTSQTLSPPEEVLTTSQKYLIVDGKKTDFQHASTILIV